MKDLLIVHDDSYANWVFDPTHPTQGRRFMLGKDMIVARALTESLSYEIAEPKMVRTPDLLRVHTPEYLAEVMDNGTSFEWVGVRRDLAGLAALFAGGTQVALDRLLDGAALTAVHLPGAKHHAQADRSSGFCVFADFAIAGLRAVEDGQRVAILDIDAHHGDGTENLTRSTPEILTFSIHEEGIFPGTGLEDDEEHLAFNWPLRKNSGGQALTRAVGVFLDLCRTFQPTVIFVAAGADGHRTDPLSTLRYEVADYREVARLLRWEYPWTPILVGGAGGYQPDGATPVVWSEFVTGLAAPY